MQIFTIEMILESIIQIKETSSLLFESILSAAWSNIIESLGNFTSAIVSLDWNSAMVSAFIAISGVILLYRLVRNNLPSTLEALFGK